MKLSASFVKDNAPTSGSVRINHNENGCSGDSDSCVIRVDATTKTISAKCYRCGAWRVIESNSFAPASRSTVIKKDVSLPTDVVPAWHHIPQEGREWLSKAHIDKALSERIGLQWSERHKRMYIPARNTYQQWWTGRSWEQNAPRYKTLATFKDSCFGYVQANKNSLTKSIWIVEDLLSMYRVALAGNDCLALCTTTISDKAVAMIGKMGYNWATISLDNDNPQVIMANSKIAQRLGWIKEVSRSSLASDPKHYSIDELKERVK